MQQYMGDNRENYMHLLQGEDYNHPDYMMGFTSLTAVKLELSLLGPHFRGYYEFAFHSNFGFISF